MSKIEEIEFPNEINIDIAKEIVGRLRDIDVLVLKGDFKRIKIVKFVSPVELFLVFGEKYICDSDDDCGWVDILKIFDNLEELAWFINSL